MSPLPAQMEDHWASPPGVNQDRAQLMWFMCLRGDPVAAELAGLGQARLAGLDGLDMVPAEWLHVTTLITGYADEIYPDQVRAMTSYARAKLGRMPPIEVTLGRVLYHPRAIMLAASPMEALLPVLAACREATHAGTGHTGQLYSEPWIPHMTLAYGNSVSPTAPAIEALGRNLPAQHTYVKSVSLVSQAPRQKWQWDLVDEIPLSSAADIPGDVASR